MPAIDDVVEASWNYDGYERGDGSCAPAGTQPGQSAEVCTVATGDNAAYSEPIDYMFAAGATEQISTRVTGKTDKGAEFAYALSTWHFESAETAAAAPLVGLIESCDAVIHSAEDDRQRHEVFIGDEPHLRLVIDDDDVLLYRGFRLSDGPEAVSASELLPTAAVDHVETWWLANTADGRSTEP